MFSKPNFPMLTAEQANPWHTGMQWSNDLLQQALANQQQQALNKIYGAQAKYAEPTSQLGLQKEQLLNKIYGAQAKYAEPMEASNLEKAKLANAYQQQVNQFYAPLTQADIASKGAHTELARQQAANALFNRQNPLLLGQETKNLGALLADPRFSSYVQEALKQQPSQGAERLGSQDVAQNPMQSLVEAMIKKPSADVAYKEQLAKSSAEHLASNDFDKMPAPFKSAAIAQARAFGLNETEATKLFREGKTLGDIAEMQKYSRDGSDWPSPGYAPTSTIQTQQQRANIAQAGIQAIEPDIAKDLAPYAKKWNGTSLSQLYDSMKGNSDEKIGRAIGAAAMAQELSMLRLRSAGANVGIGALRESLDASKTRLHIPDLTLTPKQFEIAQNYIADHVSKLNKAENKALYPQGQAKGKSEVPNIPDEKISELARRKGKSPEEIRMILKKRGML